jgi:hypothetical protein
LNAQLATAELGEEWEAAAAGQPSFVDEDYKKIKVRTCFRCPIFAKIRYNLIPQNYLSLSDGESNRRRQSLALYGRGEIPCVLQTLSCFLLLSVL